MHSFRSIKCYTIFSTIHRKVLLTKIQISTAWGDGLLQKAANSILGLSCLIGRRLFGVGRSLLWLLPLLTCNMTFAWLALFCVAPAALEVASFVSSHFYPATLPAWLALSLADPATSLALSWVAPAAFWYKKKSSTEHFYTYCSLQLSELESIAMSAIHYYIELLHHVQDLNPSKEITLICIHQGSAMSFQCTELNFDSPRASGNFSHDCWILIGTWLIRTSTPLPCPKRFRRKEKRTKNKGSASWQEGCIPKPLHGLSAIMVT